MGKVAIVRILGFNHSFYSNMNLVTWNVRGLNKPYKQKEFRLFMKNNNVVIIAVLEHRVKE